MSGDSSPGQPGLSQPLFSDKGPQIMSPPLSPRDPQPQLDGGQFTTTVSVPSSETPHERPRCLGRSQHLPK